jgi:hypothetical protein
VFSECSSSSSVNPREDFIDPGIPPTRRSEGHCHYLDDIAILMQQSG